ncbi:hypothetical protein AAG906_032060 [Vitis piasezkii]
MGLLACNVPRIKYRVKLEKIDSRLNSDLGWPNYVNMQASPNPSTSPSPSPSPIPLRRRKDLSRHASLPQSPPLSQLKISGVKASIFLVVLVQSFGVFGKRGRGFEGKKMPFLNWKMWKMKKGLHPQMQWISYVTQSGRLMHVMMTRIHSVGKVYHLRARRQMAQSVGQIAKFKRRYEQKNEENEEK